MNILLIRLRLVGDVVFTTPAIRALRRRFPDARITYLVERAAAPVVRGNPAPRRRDRRRAHARSAPASATMCALARTLRASALRPRDRLSRRPAQLVAHVADRRAACASATTIPGRSWMYTDRVDRPRELRPRHSVENQWDLLAAARHRAARPRRTIRPRWRTTPDARRRVGARRWRAAGIAADAELDRHPRQRRQPVPPLAGGGIRRARRRARAQPPRRRIVLTSGPSECDAAAAIADAAREAARAGCGRRASC